MNDINEQTGILAKQQDPEPTSEPHWLPVDRPPEPLNVMAIANSQKVIFPFFAYLDGYDQWRNYHSKAQVEDVQWWLAKWPDFPKRSMEDEIRDEIRRLQALLVKEEQS